MKKLLFIIMTAAIGVQASAQAPNNEAIRGAVGDPGSVYYYPALMARYVKGDSTLTATDYHYLYYGFAFQDEYKPLDPIPGENNILSIIETRKELTVGDAEDIITYANQVMAHDPFSPSNINFMTYAYGLLGDTERERQSARRLEMVLKTIEASGAGDKEDSPWHVTFFTHVNDFLAWKGYEPRERRVVSRSVEFVIPVKAEKKNKGFYFDYSRAYSKPPTHMPEKPKGLKPKL